MHNIIITDMKYLYYNKRVFKIGFGENPKEAVMGTKTLTLKSKTGYMFGDLANGLTFGMSATFLLAFYTDVLGITAAAAGILFLVARIWDGINDPMMGALTDKMFRRRALKHKGQKVDKFRPFLLKGSWPVVFAAILMFIAPASLSMTQKLIWAYVTYILWGMSYTFINIPYGSLAAVMTQDSVERSSLSAARGLGGLLGALIPRIVVPMLLAGFADNEQAKAYLIVMIVIGVISFVSYILCYIGVEETVIHHIDEKSEPLNLKEGLKGLLKNRPFIAVCIASLGILFGLGVNGTMTYYYFNENLQDLSKMAITGVTMIVPMLIVIPLVSKIVAKFGIKRTMTVSSMISTIAYGAILFLPDSFGIYLALTMVGGLFLVIPNMLIWGMVSDCIDYNQYLTGQRQEGVVYGLYSFIRKTGQALAGFVAGIGLGLVGYNASLETQSTSTLFGIKFLTVGSVAISMLIAYLAFQFIWNLTEAKKQEITEFINKSSEV